MNELFIFKLTEKNVNKNTVLTPHKSRYTYLMSLTLQKGKKYVYHKV